MSMCMDVHQAFSQDSKSGRPDCTIGPALMNNLWSNIWKTKQYPLKSGCPKDAHLAKTLMIVFACLGYLRLHGVDITRAGHLRQWSQWSRRTVKPLFSGPLLRGKIRLIKRSLFKFPNFASQIYYYFPLFSKQTQSPFKLSNWPILL